MDDTFDTHTNAEGEFTAQRRLIHAEIITGLLGDAPARNDPEIVFMAGGPASGKSTLARSSQRPERAVVINPDEVRERLPEYEGLVASRPQDAARMTHREASQV